MTRETDNVKIELDTRGSRNAQSTSRLLLDAQARIENSISPGVKTHLSINMLLPVYRITEDDKEVDRYLAINEIEFENHTAANPYKDQILKEIEADARKTGIRIEKSSHSIDAPATWWFQMILASADFDNADDLRKASIGWLGAHLSDRDLGRSFIDWKEGRAPTVINIQGVDDMPDFKELLNILQRKLSRQNIDDEFMLFHVTRAASMSHGAALHLWEISPAGFMQYDAEAFIGDAIDEQSVSLGDYIIDWDGDLEDIFEDFGSDLVAGEDVDHFIVDDDAEDDDAEDDDAEDDDAEDEATDEVADEAETENHNEQAIIEGSPD